MPMKMERRGKYPGVKIHFEKKHCERIIALAKDPLNPDLKAAVDKMFAKLSKQLYDLSVEDPKLLEERTEEEIIAELEEEKKKSELKLAQLANGKDWKKVTKDPTGQVIVTK